MTLLISGFVQEEYVFEGMEDVQHQHQPLEVLTTTIEVQADPNGSVNIMEQDHVVHPPVNGHVNGVAAADAPAPPVQNRPELYDMDLERMHTQLYKGRYLTPQDFLDDVGKIVHNAATRQVEDLDRLYKAQAMFTATQVSIHEFDPQLKVECERMAVRERARREAAREAVETANAANAKGKGKEKENGGGSGNGSGTEGVPGARRSARHNGLQPEHAITDPVQLERRLKRQRSDGAATDSHGSDEDGVAGRDAKRSKMTAATTADGYGSDDPLQLGPSRAMAVRFAGDQPQPMDLNEPLEPMQSLAPHMIDPALYSTSPDAMAVDSPPSQRPSGFASLLNPAPPTPSTSTANDDPFLAGPSDLNSTSSLPIHSILQATPAPGVATVPSSPSQRPKSAEPEPVPPPIPIVVERTPTPPLPDFHLDEELVTQLETALCDLTGSLTIEQLEQLRATCLATIWRHRTEWERNPAVRELHDLVKEFVDQVGTDDSDADM